MKDTEYAAILAYNVEQETRKYLQGSDIGYNRVNWRNVLANRTGGNNQNPFYGPPAPLPQNQQFPPGYNQQQNNLPQHLPNNIPGYFIPENVNAINDVLNKTDPHTHNPSNIQNITGFDVPSYNNSAANIISEDKIDLIVKEIKSMKKLISKLIRTMEPKIDTNTSEINTES